MSTLQFSFPELKPDPLPLRMDEDGSIRVGLSRITLDVLIDYFESGVSPEEIADDYDTLDRADVYSVLAYYMRHKSDFQPYFKRRELEALELERKIVEAKMTWPDARTVLPKRWLALKAQGDASTSDRRGFATRARSDAQKKAAKVWISCVCKKLGSDRNPTTSCSLGLLRTTGF